MSAFNDNPQQLNEYSFYELTQIVSVDRHRVLAYDLETAQQLYLSGRAIVETNASTLFNTSLDDVLHEYTEPTVLIASDESIAEWEKLNSSNT